MKNLLFTIFFAMAIWLIWRNASSLNKFEQAYRHNGGFPGTRYKTIVRRPQSESRLEIYAGTDSDALYLLKDLSLDRFRFRFLGPHATLPYDLRIPWRDLIYKPYSLALWHFVWFDVPSHAQAFFIPEEMAHTLLADAGKPIPRR